MFLNNGNPTRLTVILLDVYETLLDMSEVERRVNSLMNSKRGYTIWFDLFMKYCFVDNSTAQFHDFLSIGRATMQMAGSIVGRTIEEDEMNDILELLRHLPLHDEVQEGLSALRDHGFRIAALTNSPRQTVLDRMERTGLVSYFEIVLSAEQVKKYKPGIEVYKWAADKLKVNINEILMVSSHGWDIAGSAYAGMQTAFIRRDRQMLYPLAPAPIFISDNLADLSKQIEMKQAIESTGTK